MTTTNLSILLVDDDCIILEIFSKALACKYPNSTILSAGNGKIALELYKTHVPAITITDIVMTEMDGIQLAGHIRTITPDAQIIAITGYSGNQIAKGATGNEFDYLIVKPVDFHDFFTTVDCCIEAFMSYRRS